MLHGWLIIDKPLGVGSTDAVSATKRALRAGGYPKAKVGHGGTLDPLATGVLPIALGEATKLAGRLLDGDKTYEFTVRFGEETATLDAEGAVVATSDIRPTAAEVQAVLPRFTGPIAQKPPVYSALKVDGKRAYDLARAGEEVTLASRDVTIHALSIPSPASGEGGNGQCHPHRPRLQGHLHPLASPRHRPRARHGGPRHDAPPHEGRAVRSRPRDNAGRTGRIRAGARA